MDPVLFNIGNFRFYTYGTVVSGSLVVGMITCWFLVRKLKSKALSKFDTLLFIGLIGLAGARLSYFLLNYYKFDSFWEMFYFSQSGLTAYGGIIASSLYCVGYFIKNDENLWSWLDNLIIGFFAAYLAGNLGLRLIEGSKLFNYGIFWLIITTCYLIFLRFYNKVKIPEGMLYLIGLLSFGLMQIVLDINSAGIKELSILSLNQIFSVLLVIGILFVLILPLRRKPFRLTLFEKRVKFCNKIIFLKNYALRLLVK